MSNDQVVIKFTYTNRQKVVDIYTPRNEPFKNVLIKLNSKTYENYDSSIFLCGGKMIDLNSTINEINNKDKEIIILIISPYMPTNDEKIKSKNIICPKCQKNCMINFENYKISLSGCDDNHLTSNIFFEEFENSQLINLSKIQCENCTFNRSNIINKEFYKCFSCQKNLCPECKKKHDLNHNIVEYDDANYICQRHKDNNYEYYCKDCQTNLCSSCLTNHKNHNLINFYNNPNQGTNRNNDDENNQIIFNIFKNELNGIKSMMDVISDNFELYFKIIKDINENYDDKHINYKIYCNKNNLNKYKIINDMKRIINQVDIKEKLYYLYQIYQKLIKRDINIEDDNNSINTPKKSPMNEIEISYKNNKNTKLQLFGKEFVINNKDKCKIKYKNNLYDLQFGYDNKSFFNFDENLKIKLQIFDEVTDLSYMFKDCSLLTGLSNNKINTEKISDMSYMFMGCTSLNYCSGISKWNTSNVTNMSNMFYGCESLESLPDISKWDTKNVKYMNYMFSKCKQLKSFPNINNWNTSKMKCSIGIFSQINENIYPDISNWNNKNQVKSPIFNNTPQINIQNFQKLYQNIPDNFINLTNQINLIQPLGQINPTDFNKNSSLNHISIDTNKNVSNNGNLIPNSMEESLNVGSSNVKENKNNKKKELDKKLIVNIEAAPSNENNVNKITKKEISDNEIDIRKVKKNQNSEKNKEKKGSNNLLQKKPTFIISGIIPGAKQTNIKKKENEEDDSKSSLSINNSKSSKTNRYNFNRLK